MREHCPIDRLELSSRSVTHAGISSGWIFCVIIDANFIIAVQSAGMNGVKKRSPLLAIHYFNPLPTKYTVQNDQTIPLENIRDEYYVFYTLIFLSNIYTRCIVKRIRLTATNSKRKSKISTWMVLVANVCSLILLIVRERFRNVLRIASVFAVDRNSTRRMFLMVVSTKTGGGIDICIKVIGCDQI